MNDLISYLREVKTRNNIKSDREFALKVGLTQAAMSNFMGGAGSPNDESCIKIARFAGDDPARVIALAHKCKATENSRPYWDKLLKALATASIAILLFLSVLPVTAHADSHNGRAQCILC